MAQNSQLGYFMSAMISPQRMIKSLQQHIAIPMLQQNLTKIPDPLIPSFALDVINGMIETRVEKGELYIPFLDVALGASPFRDLKSIFEKNLAEYREDQAPANNDAEVVSSKEEPITI